MNVREFTVASLGSYLNSLRNVRLKGHDQKLIYKECSIDIIPMDPRSVYPCQNYVLSEDRKTIMDLHREFKRKGLNIFQLDSVVNFWIEGDEENESIPLTPPVIEVSEEPDGTTIPLICDGMHRVCTAMLLGETINVALVRGPALREYPYYAYPLKTGWKDVVELEALPDNYQKKEYRDPENYKALFRMFNEVFPGIQKQRKKSNPDHIKE